MPSPKSTTSTSLNQEVTEVETQAYYNESLDYNYISSRFAYSLGLRPDADREAKPRAKSVSKPKIPFKPKNLVRSQTAPAPEFKPLQRSRTEPLSKRVLSHSSRENTMSEDTPASTSTTRNTVTSPNLPPRIPPRRTSTTATLVPSNSQAPPIFSLLEPMPEGISRSSLTSPLFPAADLNPFSPRPGATFGTLVVDTLPRTAQRPRSPHIQTEGTPSLFEAINPHPVIPGTNLPTILSEEPETISEEPEGISEEPLGIPKHPEPERNLEGMGMGTGIGMGFGIGGEIRGREHDQDPNTMSGDLTLHWKSSPLSRYTQRTVFWIVPHAKFDVVFGHDETDFNIPVRNSTKWGLGGWGLGTGLGARTGRRERNQFREGIRRGVLKKVEEQSTFSLLHSATNIMDMWLRPPYPTHARGNSRDSDSKTPLLGNPDEQGRNIREARFTLPQLQDQLRNELNCTDERRRKHEAKRAVNIWDVRAGKAVLAEQAKGASGEIRKLVGAVVKDVQAREGGTRVVATENSSGVGRAPPLEEHAEAAHDKIVHVKKLSGPAASAVATSNDDITTQAQAQAPLETSHPITPSPLQTGAAPHLPNPQTFELTPTTPTTANQTANQSRRSSLRIELTDSQMQAQIQAQLDRETETHMEREIQAQMETEMREQIERQMSAQDTPPQLPPRPRKSISPADVDPDVKSAREATPPQDASSDPAPPAWHATDRGAHDSSDGETEAHEGMSEVGLAHVPGRAPARGEAEGGGARETARGRWEREDGAIHAERRIWRERFAVVLGQLLRVRRRA